MESLDPSLLSVHPLLAAVPTPPGEQEAIEGLRADVQARGFDQPLTVDERNQVLDGRRRLRVALMLNAAAVPIRRRLDDGAAGIILGSLVHRRHFRKSALAYLAFPLLQPALAEAQKRHLAALKQGKSSVVPSGHYGKTVEEIAHSCGFSRRVFYRAKQVHELFARESAYKEQMEPLLLTDDVKVQVGLQGVLAGWTGQQNAGQHRRISDQLDLFGDVFGKLRYHFARTWVSLDADRRQALAPQVRDTVAEMPPEIREMFAREIRAAEKAAREAGQKV